MAGKAGKRDPLEYALRDEALRYGATVMTWPGGKHMQWAITFPDGRRRRGSYAFHPKHVDVAQLKCRQDVRKLARELGVKPKETA